ncbi:MAG TPA: ATP-binding protein [Bryobacteraceae bacterium]|nr:ATP-binding protein [Bryobacteraceae bacterium]
MQRSGLDSTTEQLLYSAVHDLRGPASRIRLSAQLLSRNGAALDDEARTLIRYMQDSAAAVETVAAGLRRYHEVCARPLERVSIELSATVSAAIHALAAEIAASGATVTHSALRTINADPFLMGWLFQELLANAIRFCGQEPPCVHFSRSTGDPGGWYIAVSDNGSGIEAGMEKRIFRPFQKLDGTGGSGIGLTICKRIVELHGGELWTEPRACGAEFRFYVGR